MQPWHLLLPSRLYKYCHNCCYRPSLSCSASYNRYFVLPYYCVAVVVVEIDPLNYSSVPVSRPVRVLLSAFFLLYYWSITIGINIIPTDLVIVVDLHHNRDHPSFPIVPIFLLSYRIYLSLFACCSNLVVLVLRRRTPTDDR